MTTSLKFSALFVTIALVFSGFRYADEGDKSAQAGWKPIFNGRNLDGWKIKIAGFPLGENFGNTFRVANGILSIRYDQYGDNFNNRFGALYYDRKLRNYRLKVEYRFVGETAPGAPTWGFRDSGIQYLGQDPKPLGSNSNFLCAWNSTCMAAMGKTNAQRVSCAFRELMLNLPA